MSTVRTCFTCVIVFLFAWLIGTCILNRTRIEKAEGFNADKSLPSSVINTTPPGVLSLTGGAITNKQTKKAENEDTTVLQRKLALPLIQVCVKSSFQSCYDGKDVNIKMLEYVISRGCRVLDFEVFNVDETAVIGFSYAAAGRGLIPKNEASAKVTLDDALATVIVSAFNNSTAPNPDDPLFVHLRVRANSSDVAFLTTIARALEANFKGRMYHKSFSTITNNIGEIMGKIVVMLDVSILPNYSNSDLISYVHIETGTSSVVLNTANALMTKPATNPHGIDNGLQSTVTRLIMTTPDNTYLSSWTTNPDYENALLKPYGVQMNLVPFYKNDSNLKAYEEFFKTAVCGIIPLQSVL